MSRSSKKGPYIDEKLLKKVTVQKQGGSASANATAAGKQKTSIKTWARNSQIPPDFVGLTFLVHNGKEFKEVFVTEAMVGHRLGEFSATRTFRGHGKIVKRVMTKT